MRSISSLLFLLCYFSSQAQTTAFEIDIRPIFDGESIVLDEPIITSAKDTLTISKLKFYMSNIVFDFFGKQVHKDSTSYLIDLSDSTSLNYKVVIPFDIAFSHIYFDLGVDSLTNVSGAHGGDLDPMHGMYWTWQSGYINFKLEGTASNCPGRKNEFIYHIGGYHAPYETVQNISLEVFENNWVPITMDIGKLNQSLDMENDYHIMSPGEETVNLAQAVAKIFEVIR